MRGVRSGYSSSDCLHPCPHPSQTSQFLVILQQLSSSPVNLQDSSVPPGRRQSCQKKGNFEVRALPYLCPALKILWRRRPWESSGTKTYPLTYSESQYTLKIMKFQLYLKKAYFYDQYDKKAVLFHFPLTFNSIKLLVPFITPRMFSFLPFVHSFMPMPPSNHHCFSPHISWRLRRC